MTTSLATCAVFYDGSCPLCAAEIGVYRAQDTAGALTMIDVTQQAILPDGLTRAAALARFHVLTQDGVVLSGAAAFAEVWRALPGWRWLALAGAIVGRPRHAVADGAGLQGVSADPPLSVTRLWPGLRALNFVPCGQSGQDRLGI